MVSPFPSSSSRPDVHFCTRRHHNFRIAIADDAAILAPQVDCDGDAWELQLYKFWSKFSTLELSGRCGGLWKNKGEENEGGEI